MNADTVYCKIIIFISECIGIAFGVFAVLHWIEFANTEGSFSAIPGSLTILRFLFNWLIETISWQKQDLFWLALFTTCLSTGFLFIPFMYSEAIALAYLGIPGIILSVPGSIVLFFIYHFRFKQDALVTTVISYGLAIAEMLLLLLAVIIGLIVIVLERKAKE